MNITQPIGILGGTFDPIHLGHIHIARELLQRLSLNQVRFIPCYLPPHRDMPEANAEQRMQMVKLALENLPNFVADNREIQRNNTSYMIDTITSLRNEFSNTPLVLIMGVDQFDTFDTWHHWQEILQYTHLAIVNRPGYQLITNQNLDELLKNHQTEDKLTIQNNLYGQIIFQDIAPSPISATDTRSQLHLGKNAEPFVPAAVWQYIQTNNLYIPK